MMTVFCLLISPCNFLQVLFFMSCYGGHFGTMSSLLFPICTQNNCTVIESAQLCEKKLEVFHNFVKIDVIKRHGLPNDYPFSGNYDLLFSFCPRLLEGYEFSYNVLKEILEKDREKFDILVVDQVIFPSTLVAAELFDVPVVVESVAVPGAVECIQDKIEMSIYEIVALKPFFTKCWNWIDQKRSENDLPKLDFQGNFVINEYASRFPMLVPTSPLVYPKPHPSAVYIYFGGLRDENFSNVPLESDLENWIRQSAGDIVYVSLGTHAVLNEQSVKSFLEKIENQNSFRVIWAMSQTLKLVAENARKKMSDKVFISGYLPQYSLLAEEKVKVFVSHCGLGSLVDFIKRRKPAVCVPQFGDQFPNAVIVENLKIGLDIRNFNFDQIENAIQKIQKNYQNFVTNLTEVEKEFAQFEDYNAINEFVHKIASRGKTTVQYKLKYQINVKRVHVTWKVITVLSCSSLLCFILFVVNFISRLMAPNDEKKKKH